MTQLEQLLKTTFDTAALLSRSDEEEGRALQTSTEQRIAVGLVEARAAECRHLAGELDIRGLTQHPDWKVYRNHLIDRARRLTALGVEFAKEWPPKAPEPIPPALVV